MGRLSILVVLAVALAACAGDAGGGDASADDCASTLNLAEGCGVPLREDSGAPEPDATVMGTRWTCRCYEIDERGMQRIGGTPLGRANPRVCATSRRAAFDTAGRMCAVGTDYGCNCYACCPVEVDARVASSDACAVDPVLECGDLHWDGDACRLEPTGPSCDQLGL